MALRVELCENPILEAATDWTCIQDLQKQFTNRRINLLGYNKKVNYNTLKAHCSIH